MPYVDSDFTFSGDCEGDLRVKRNCLTYRGAQNDYKHFIIWELPITQDICYSGKKKEHKD